MFTNSKDPRIKNPGVFVFRNGKMHTELKKKQQAEWWKQNRLTPEQVKKLVEDKIARARQHYEAEKKREELYGFR